MELKFRTWYEKMSMWTYFDLHKGFGSDVALEVYRELILNGAIFLQFTGFNDKTGKEIYVGDILQGYDGNPKAPKFTVTFEHGCFCWGGEPLGYDFESHDVDGNPEKSNPSKWATIVGNIYENK